MKAKLGSLKKMGAVKYDGFKGLLKKSIIATLQDPKANGISSFVLLSGETKSLKWKCGDEVTKPLLYLDSINKPLVAEIKADNTIDLNKYAYGKCKVTRVGNDVTIYLCPEKGKLTQAALIKPLKKAFKTFKPKVFLEVVADLNTIEAPSGTAEGISPDTDEVKIDIKNIGDSLLKYHKGAQGLKKQLKDMPKEAPARQELLIKQSKVQKHLKHLCNSWKEDVLPLISGSATAAPSATGTTTPNIDENWSKAYDYWSKFFAKRKAAKEGTTNDTEAREAEEERIYVNALKDVERFMDNIEKGYSIDPQVIENDIEDLKTHLQKWKTFVNGKSTKADELKTMEELLADINKKWAAEKSVLQEYYDTAQTFDKAIKDKKSIDDKKTIERILKLYKQLEKLAEA
jgi:hypothetical protein